MSKHSTLLWERSPIRLDGPDLQGNSFAQSDQDGLELILTFHIELGISVQEPIPTGLGLVARKGRAHEIRLRTFNQQIAFSIALFSMPIGTGLCLALGMGDLAA